MTESRSVALDTKTLSAEGRVLLEVLKKEIVGQDRAVIEVVKAMEVARSPLRRKNRPLGVFLCMGPTGTGKTSLPKVLAKYLFKSEEALTFVSLNTYSENHRVSTLEGSPPGYYDHVDPDNPANTFSNKPPLRQWNLDRHHHCYLAKIHADEIKYLNKEIDKVKRIENEIGRMSDREKELEDEIVGIVAKLKKLPENGGAGSDRQKLSDKLAVVKNELKQLADAKSEKWSRWWRLKEATRKMYERANREGWIYSPEKPPTELMSIVVFDEIEKADSKILNHLMTIMDEAKLTLANGEEPSFRNSIIFMTSNTGQKEMDLSKRIGFGKLGLKDQDKMVYHTALAAAKKTFSPEFIGRFSKVLVFRSLRREQVMEIFDIQVRKLHDNLNENNIPLVVKVDEEVKNFLVDLAMKYPEEGARVMERRFRDKVTADLALAFNTKQLTGAGEIRVSLLSCVGEEIELGYEYFPTEPNPAE